MADDQRPSETEFEAAYRRFHEGMQGYNAAASAALLDYSKAMEAAADQFRETQQEVINLLQKSLRI